MFTLRAAFEKNLKPRAARPQISKFSTQIQVKSQQKGHQVRSCPIFYLNSSEDQKKVITSADAEASCSQKMRRWGPSNNLNRH